MSNRMKSLLVALVILSLALPSVTLAEQRSPFKDVKETHWALEAIAWGVEHRVLDGFPDGTFAPERAVTEAEFLKILIAAYESPEDQGTYWYDKYYAYAHKKQWYVQGLKDTDAANLPILRKHAAIVLSSALGSSYSDDSVASVEAAILDLYDRGLSSGKYEKTVAGFAPNDTLTRAEAVQFIYQFVNKSGLTSLAGASSIPETTADLAQDPKEEQSDNSQAAALDAQRFFDIHHNFAEDAKLLVQKYELDGRSYIRLDFKDPPTDLPPEKAFAFTSSYELSEDGSLFWVLITNSEEANPGDAFELVAAMFDYDDSYRDIRDKFAVVAKDVGYQFKGQLSAKYGNLEISSNYDQEARLYYIFCEIKM